MGQENLSNTSDKNLTDKLILFGYINLHRQLTKQKLLEDLQIGNSNNHHLHELIANKVIELKNNVIFYRKDFASTDLVFGEIHKENYRNLEGLEFDDILKIKLLAGILLLKKEIPSLKYLHNIVTNPKFPKSLIIKGKKELLGYLSLISLDQKLTIRISPEGWILCSKNEFTPILTQLTPVPGYEWINYNTLIGWFSLRKMTDLRELHDIIDLQSTIYFSIEETLIVLAFLVTDNVIDAMLDDDNSVHLIRLNKVEDDFLFNRQDRVLLGFIHSFQKKHVRELSRIMNVTQEEVKQLIYKFISQSSIILEIARDGTLICNNLTNIPTSIQPMMLPDDLKEIFGFLPKVGEIKIADLIDIWEIHGDQIISKLLELVGFGLISMTLKKNNKLMIHSKTEIKPYIKKSHTEIQQELIDLIEQIDQDQIDLDKISNQIDIPKTSIIRQLSLLVANGTFPNGHFIENDFVTGGIKTTIGKLSVCINCGAQITAEDRTCKACNTEKSYCIVCRAVLSRDDIIRKCPRCMQKGHILHLENWLLIKAKCPACREDITIHQLEGIN
ncbi:MAG: hypothetical protein ACW99A_14605 [Candidatus Kariarchaeaceae archaeon]|jgi:uncharacterized protein YtpQ (UPF0354 family)